MTEQSIYSGKQFEAATSTESLATRLRINADYSSANFSEWLFERLAVASGEQVLDVGCGTGAQTLPLADIVGPNGSISAVDISVDSIHALQRNVKPGTVVQAIAEDMAELPRLIESEFAVKTYDLVHSSYALYYSPQRIEVLNTMRNAMRPGGRCAVFTPNAPHGLVEFASKFHDVPADVWACLEFGADVLAPYFKANFARVEEHHFHNIVRIPNAEVLMSFYEATTYYQEQCVEDVRAAVDAAIAEKGEFSYEKNGYLIIGYA